MLHCLCYTSMSIECADSDSYFVLVLSGLLADLFHMVATHMVFTDLTMVFFGVSTPLERLREPLQQFVHENVLSGSPATEANIDSAVDRLMRDLQPDIDAIGVSIALYMTASYRSVV